VEKVIMKCRAIEEVVSATGVVAATGEEIGVAVAEKEEVAAVAAIDGAVEAGEGNPVFFRWFIKNIR
jgi:hypothetical protein